MKLKKGTINDLIKDTRNLMHKCKRHALTVPSILKGNIGELMTYRELLAVFPNHEIDFKGGTNPGYDILLDNTRIQVKTNHVRRQKYALFEECPTISRKTFDKDKCDAVVLLQLYFDDALTRIKNKKSYIFNKADFGYFSKVGCWSGKSKGDYTIKRLIDFNPNAPKGTIKIVNFYGKPKYERLFKESENNWKKLL